MRSIEHDELVELTEALGVPVGTEEIDDYVELVDYVLSIVAGLEKRRPEAVQNVPADRNAGRPPLPGEDPLNAVVRWCSVKGEHDGPLSGKRVVLKDSAAVAGVPMTCGSRVLEGYVPGCDSVIAERVLVAGGEIAAMSNMDDMAFSGGGDSSYYGPTLCPFDSLRTAGGSSGGSAAALWYDGLDASIGSDQGGSIRVPAAWCGVIGLKPTHGLVPYTGMVGVDQTFDHAGPLGRTVVDVARLLQAIAGKSDSDPRQRDVPVTDYIGAAIQPRADLSDVRIGFVAAGFSDDVGIEGAVATAVGEAVDRMRGIRADVTEVSLPEHVQAGDVAFTGFAEGIAALMVGGGNGYHWAGRYSPDLADALNKGIADHGTELSSPFKTALLAGAFLQRHYRGSYYAKAANLRPWLKSAYDRALAEVDVLLMPTTPGLPHPVEPGLAMPDRVKRGWAVLANTYPTDFTGHPAISIPVAEVDGLPVGVMLVGGHFTEARLLGIASTVEQTLGWLPSSGPFEPPDDRPKVPDVGSS